MCESSVGYLTVFYQAVVLTYLQRRFLFAHYDRRYGNMCEKGNVMWTDKKKSGNMVLCNFVFC